VGAGTMGAGIAQLGCLGSFEVTLHDPDPRALASGADRLRASLAKGAGKGLWAPEEAAQAEGRLHTGGFEALEECEVVIEAAPEDLDLKRKLFAQLEDTCGPEAVLATNTSSIPVTAIAAETTNPNRVCGMHFFNPPPLMRLVEVIAGESTDETTLKVATEVAHAMDREPVRAADAPGFIVNRCNRPFALEALRMLGEGVATHAEIDEVMRSGGGYRMGPFELMDLIGVDVNLKVAQSFYAQREIPRWEPHQIQKEMVAAGKLGRKTGQGFYEYEGSRKVEEAGAGRGEDARRAIMERIVSCLVNEASFAVEEGVAEPADVDIAMKLGLNHPRGPFEWQDELGAGRIVATLDTLAESAESEREAERYSVADSLRERV
ncbi:MAG TPA: 3-hydroxyacyl-CoA dehydrogenase NAD-binding domain-containing protein, partial [Solirubrobacterales bacterium]|nr:3-hydroxyacyl-CoA dehydrogenase NAD-binding domain-containing protein [Solirubrobacterales bacterium]